MFEKVREEEPVLQGQKNPFENPALIDVDEDEFAKEVDDLIEWSDNLDFDKYNSYWKNISTSNIKGQPLQLYKGWEEVSIVETEFEHVK